MKKRIALIAFLVISAMANGFAANISGTDSTKGKYPLNDPRNPNCPCHRYQAQADREYALLNAKYRVNPRAVSLSNASDTKVAHKRRFFHWRTGVCRKRPPKQGTHKRFRDKLSRCFHF